MAARFVWHEDVGTGAKTCLACQRAKGHQHVRAPLRHGQLPSRRFEQLHVDIVGPLPVSQGMKYLFTAIDSFNRWAEAESTAIPCSRAFLSQHIGNFGVPGDLIRSGPTAHFRAVDST